MDADEIRTLLGEMVFERAQKYRRRILQSSCTTNEDGVRHVSALVQGNGADCFYTQVWLRENGSFVSASCDCPYNQNGDGTYCKHIGALLLEDAAKHPAPKAPAAPESIPGVVRGTDGLNPAASRKDSYASGLEMLFGRKWRGDAPVTDQEARKLLETYQQSALQDLGEAGDPPQDTGFVELEPELTMLSGGQPWLRLRIANRERGRQYVVKSIPALLDDVEHGRSASYGRFLTFVHRWDAFDEESRQLLQLLRRQVNAKQSMETNVVRSYSYAASDAPAGGLPLTGEIFDALVQLYAPTGTLGGYALQEGLPVITMTVQRRRGGQVVLQLAGGGMQVLSTGDIYYLETHDRLLWYHTTKGEFSVRASLASAEKQLAQYHFSRCNQCYLVNLKYVKAVENDFVHVNTDHLEISRRQRAAFLTAVASYIGGVL